MSARTPAFQEMWKTGVFLIVSKPELMLILARCLLICTVEFNSDCLVFKPKSNILYSFLNSSINVTTGLHKGNYGMTRPPPRPPQKGFWGGGGDIRERGRGILCALIFSFSFFCFFGWGWVAIVSV